MGKFKKIQVKTFYGKTGEKAESQSQLARAKLIDLNLAVEVTQVPTHAALKSGLHFMMTAQQEDPGAMPT